MSFKLHLHRALGLTFCNRKLKGNVTRKLSLATCENCIRAYDKHKAVVEAFRKNPQAFPTMGLDFSSILPIIDHG